MVNFRSNIVVISFFAFFLCGCGFIDTKTDSESSNIEKLELEQKKRRIKENNEKEYIRNNIGSYVKLNYRDGGFKHDFSIINNTNYTLEEVIVTVTWTEKRFNDNFTLDKSLDKSRDITFGYIEKNSESKCITIDGSTRSGSGRSSKDNVQGQIKKIKCSALGL